MFNATKYIHFIGIGGIGMSGIAEILIKRGYKVSGSDINDNEACRRLKQKGARITIGHSVENIREDVGIVIVSSAIGADNVEVVEARQKGVPVIKRAEALAELIRSKYGVAVGGSHGKTTVTSLIGTVLSRAGFDPTVVVGGVVKDMGTNRLGSGDIMVVEADESDRSFLLLSPAISVITNVDREHMNSYEGMDDLEGAFLKFANSVPFFGASVLCVDDPVVRRFADRVTKRVVRYGISDYAVKGVYGKVLNMDHRGIVVEVVIEGRRRGVVSAPLYGRHYAANIIGAVAVCLELGVSFQDICNGIGDFPGIMRRMEWLGDVKGRRFYSDYGHHPTEISATLKAIRDHGLNKGGKVVLIFQPHRYTRTRDNMQAFTECFNDCDMLVITDLYSAGEDRIEGCDSIDIYRRAMCGTKAYVSDNIEAVELAMKHTGRGDMIVCMGAGSIDKDVRQFVHT